MEKKKAIILISHTNYLIKPGGTEKTLRAIQRGFNSNEICCINFFAINRFNGVFGCNIDGKFIGIYSEKNMAKLVYKILSKGFEIEEIIIGHLKGFDLQSLAKTLKKININIVLCIHDFYFVCNTFNFMKNKKNFCGITKPNKEKCSDCYNYLELKKFEKERNFFFNKIDEQIIKVIFPSDFCKKMWLTFFPKYEHRSFIRSNLQMTKHYVKKQQNNKTRIAFIGKRSTHKGIDLWNKLEKNENILKKYDLYYFGINTENNKYVKNIYVNNTKDNPYMMRDELRKYNIDIVILWSVIPETYSFTYYEASSSGCYILTNDKSGNIASQVKLNNNGKIYKNDSELFRDLYESNFNYNNIKFSPLEINDNENINEFKSKQIKQIKSHTKNKVVLKKYILTILYRLYCIISKN